MNFKGKVDKTPVKKEVLKLPNSMPCVWWVYKFLCFFYFHDSSPVKNNTR